jgi:hypothetical protein
MRLMSGWIPIAHQDRTQSQKARAYELCPSRRRSRRILIKLYLELKAYQLSTRNRWKRSMLKRLKALSKAWSNGKSSSRSQIYGGH